MFVSKEVSLKDLVKKIPDIIRAVITEKNKAKFGELLDKSGEMKTETSLFVANLIQDASVCAELILDMLKEPLSVAGIEIERGRALRDIDLENLIKDKIELLVEHTKSGL